MRPSLASSSLHFLFPSFFLRESFLKTMKTTKLQAALPLIFVIIMEPWAPAFLHSVSHIVRTKKKNVFHGYRQRPWCSADDSASTPLPATLSSVAQRRSLETHCSAIFLYVWMLESASQRHLHQVWKPERTLSSSRQTHGQSADAGVSKKALENHLLQRCMPLEFLEWKQ